MSTKSHYVPSTGRKTKLTLILLTISKSSVCNQVTETAKSMRMSLKQQLKERKTNFNLLPVPKKPDSQTPPTKKTKLRLRKVSVPSPKSILPKCVFSKGPIAYGLVPRPKAPEGYDFDLKSSKQRSRRSMMSRECSGFTERADSNRSLGSISSNESDQSLSIRDLLEDDEEETVAEEPQKPIAPKESMNKSCPNLVTPTKSPGRTGRRSLQSSSASVRSFRNLQSSSSVKSFNCSSSSLNGRNANQDAYYYRSPSLQRVNHSGSARSLQRGFSSTGSIGNSSQRSSRNLQSYHSSTGSIGNSSQRSSRNLKSYHSSTRSMGNSASSIGGRQESTADNYPVLRKSVRRNTKDLEDEMEITSHSVASQGRRKKRLSAGEPVTASPTTSPGKFGRSARQRAVNKARTSNLSECRSWVFYEED